MIDIIFRPWSTKLIYFPYHLQQHGQCTWSSCGLLLFTVYPNKCGNVFLFYEATLLDRYQEATCRERVVVNKLISALACVCSKRFQREKGRAKKREVGGRGEERKETLADRPRDFENRPLRNSCMISLDHIY